MASVAAALGLDPAEVRAGFMLVRTRLRPSAGPGRAEPEAVPPAPDVLVRREADGALTVEVADSRWFGLRTATITGRVRADRAAVTWLAEHRRAAAALIHQLDARASVLRRVAELAVVTQRRRFDVGPEGQVDLSRAAAAARLGLHPSTVSRAVTGKVVRGPRGELFAFSGLFGSGAAARHHLARLIAEWPRSDADLAAALAEAGHPVARRTVAKYRAQLGIAARTPLDAPGPVAGQPARR
jgi:RNA polymerase sigma-54 factor